MSKQPIGDAEFWLLVRAALIQMVCAIERRYDIKHPYAPPIPPPEQAQGHGTAVPVHTVTIGLYTKTPE